MQLLQEYYEEIYGSKVITDDKTYLIIYNIYDDRSCFVRLTFVTKEERGKKSITFVEDKIIEKESPTSFWCEIEKKNKNWDRIAYTYIRRQGYKIDSTDDDKVVLYREL